LQIQASKEGYVESFKRSPLNMAFLMGAFRRKRIFAYKKGP